jgi:hypothetical protein
MFLIEADTNELFNNQTILLWIEGIEDYILQEKIDKSKIKAYYSYGFFVNKSKNTLEELSKSYEQASELLYEDRLVLEKSKLRINLTLKIGNLALTNRLPKEFIPKNINDLVNEIVKVKMTIENQINYNKDVAESIPELSGLIAFEIITDTYLNTNTAPQLDMDEILDKISISGFNSLTDEEKDFLDKKSKDV